MIAATLGFFLCLNLRIAFLAIVVDEVEINGQSIARKERLQYVICICRCHCDDAFGQKL
jgi:hypothetical protein